MKKLCWLLPLLAGCGQNATERQNAGRPVPQLQVADQVPAAPPKLAAAYTSGDRATPGPLDTLHVSRGLVLWLVPGSKSDFVNVSTSMQDKGENFCLRAEPASQVQRRGHTLYLQLQNGRQLQLRDNTSDMRGDDNEAIDTRYEFRGSLHGRPYWLVDSSWYEGGLLLLVNKKSGRTTRLLDNALVSPDHRQLLTSHVAGLEGDTPVIELLSVSDATAKTLWFRRLYQWQVDRAAWLDRNTLAIRRVRFDSTYLDTARHTSYVRLLIPN